MRNVPSRSSSEPEPCTHTQYVQINDKLERARLLDEQAAAMRRSAPPKGSGASAWLGGALFAIPGLGGSKESGGEALRQSAEALQAMEITLAGDVNELVAEQQRARVRLWTLWMS